MNTNKFRGAVGALLCFMICASSAISFSGCENGKTQTATSDETAATSVVMSTPDETINAVDSLKALGIDAENLGIEPTILHDTENKVGFQLDPPKDGDTIAIMHTSMGDITMRFFPDQAPKAVTNFISLAKEGKYNNTTFHRVVRDFIIQGGHCGTDTTLVNGTSSYGQNFEDEFCDKLFNIRGAVSMANNGADTNGSQFFINQTTAERFKADGGFDRLEKLWINIKTQLVNYKDSELLSAFIQKNGTNCYNTEVVPSEVRALYEENGGNAYLDGAFNAVDRGHTVFAQVIDGMDIVDKISTVKVNDEYKPDENIIIKFVEVTTYSTNNTQSTTA